MSLKNNRSIPAAAAIVLLALATPAAYSAQTETTTAQPPAASEFVTRAELKRVLATGNFATKAEVAELRASLEALRARLNALKTQVYGLKQRLEMPQTTPPASTTP